MKERVKVCNNLVALRRGKGYTQAEFSEMTNLSQQYISTVERGIIIPSLPKAIKIAEALGECYCNVFYRCEMEY